jgi:5-methylcytosine-specific restriction endonuclease McrA
MAIDNVSVLARLQAARTPKEKKKPLPIAKQSEKAKAKVAEEKALFAADKDFYLEIWIASPHVCQECNKKLGKEPLTLFFHHLVPKSSHPAFRHTPENIMILCPDCHSQAEADLDKVPKVKQRRDEVEKLLIP